MLKTYELKLNNIEYWKQITKSGSQVFVKDKIDSFALYLDKLGNPKGMPKTNGNYFIDLISGRVISILEDEEYIVIKPSGIKVAKNCLIKNPKAISVAAEIVANDCEEDKYVSISEDIIYNTYFCEKISSRDGIKEIPLNLVNEEIAKAREARKKGGKKTMPKTKSVYEYIGSNDSETVAKLLSDFEYDPSKTEEVLRGYKNLPKSGGNLEEANNQSKEVPTYEMRLYSIDGEYFESIDELLNYCQINNRSTNNLVILDYYREFAGCSDVVKRQDCDAVKIFTVVNEDNFDICNIEKSMYCGKFVWDGRSGNIRKYYEPFRDRGIVFENDIYSKYDEEKQRILRQYN